MQKVILITIGRVKESWAKDGCTFYTERLKHVLKFDIIELPASRETDSNRQKSDESARLMKFLKGYDADMYILDERGKGMKSSTFAKTVSAAKDAGRTLVFVLGGAYGMTPEVCALGTPVKLSDMVMPHELCRVVFLEQLYRATEIGRGSGYHH